MAAIALFCCSARGQTSEPVLVNIKSVDPAIIIDLRYATDRNITRKAIYPRGMQAYVRPPVAERLVAAQKFLRSKGYGLKIWDAFRPKSAQQVLWKATSDQSYVADPNGGVGSMHTRGVAVDATLVDSWGRDIEMPTDFDSFTPAAMLVYTGNSQNVRSHLTILQRAMARSGFYGLRTEWWHFCAEDWAKYPPIDPAAEPEQPAQEAPKS